MRRLNERDGLLEPALERTRIRGAIPITVDLAGAGPGSSSATGRESTPA